MRHRRLFVLAVLLLLTAAFLPASAFALTAAESACRDEIAAGITRYVGAVGKLVIKCNQERSSGDRSLADDCNDPDVAGAGGRRQRAADTLRDAIVDGCHNQNALLAGYGECP